MRREVRWADPTYEQIAGHLAGAGTPVGVPVVERLLEEHGYVTRKARKSRATGGHPDRNRRFEDNARLKREYLESDDPIVSMDTRKEDLIGNFHRAGHLPTQGAIESFDHDLPGFAEGVVIPHGLYDVKRNDGHVNLGTGHDTGEFARDSIERWWERRGETCTPERPRSSCCATGREQQRQPSSVQGGARAGREYAAGFKGNMKVVIDEILPEWNYRAVPSRS